MDYSQYGEQKFILDYFGEKTGFLVDIGAADGVNNSNTKKLIENGWGGLLIEPTPVNYNKLLELYSDNNYVTVENCGCGNETKVLKFYIDNNDEYHQISTYSEEQKMGCESFYNCTFDEINSKIFKTQELFTKHNLNIINFITIDTEGYDNNVLYGIDFDKTIIDLICVESINQECINFLFSKNFKLIHSTTGNKFFKNINLL